MLIIEIVVASMGALMLRQAAESMGIEIERDGLVFWAMVIALTILLEWLRTTIAEAGRSKPEE